ncbi:MAG: A/G-specific adenine glycosylase [Bacteroidales bacterium]|nr:A/G-specific adenine glycosylase [Bacteroidales bacterium]
MTFSKILITWYNKNKRELPWRNTTDPYKIWVSEIILQQTRIIQGLDYYNKFIKKFPTIYHLANASIDELMLAWQGLGYYSRARYMHFTANYIVKNYKGQFPEKYHELLKLKGIGRYTAAAIASIAFNEPVAVVDGNVFRVLSRHFGIHKPINSNEGIKYFNNKAKKLISKTNPSIYNQAIMDFGAIICIPKNPQCHKCPLIKTCRAYNYNQVELLPKKINNKKIKNRFFNYLAILQNNSIYIKKRTQDDIWKSLYEFPLVETNKEITGQELKKTDVWLYFAQNKTTKIQHESKTYKHILTHRIIYTKFYIIKINDNKLYSSYNKIKINDLHNYPFPKLIINFINAIKKTNCFY